MVLKQPEVLAMGTAGPLESLAWMEQEMGMDREQMRKLLLKQPRVLSSSVEASMTPAVLFLAEELALPLEKIRTIMQKFPEVWCGKKKRLDLRFFRLVLCINIIRSVFLLMLVCFCHFLFLFFRVFFFFYFFYFYDRLCVLVSQFSESSCF